MRSRLDNLPSAIRSATRNCDSACSRYEGTGLASVAHLSALEHKDLISIDNSAQPVCDHNARLLRAAANILCQVAQLREDLALSYRVHLIRQKGTDGWARAIPHLTGCAGERA